MYLSWWKCGKPAALDVTVISPLQKLTIEGAASTQVHALQVGEDRKRAGHGDACQSAGIHFVPLVLESLRGWSRGAVETITAIGRLQRQRLGLSTSETTAHLFKKLSVCLWRGNACTWASRAPVQSPIVDRVA